MNDFKLDIENIEEIKRLKKNNRRGWSKNLLPYCEKFFDAKYSLKEIQQRFIELYDLYVGVDTLEVLRKNYLKEKNLSPTKANSTNPISLSSSVSNSKSPTEVKTELNTTPNEKKKLSKEEKERLLENAVKAMQEAEHRAAYPRNDFDEFIERQQAKKNSSNDT